MFGQIGMLEVAVLLALALFIFGPERLPKMVSDLGKGLRQVRRMAMSARNDLREGLGPEMRDLDFDDLNPRNFVRKHLLEDSEDHEYGSAAYRNNGQHRGSGLETGPAGSGGGLGSGQRVNMLGEGEHPPYDSDAT